MDDLILALQILALYGKPEYPTSCEHDCLWICGINPAEVSGEHKARLEELGFEVNEEYGQFYSFKFGSA